MKQLTSWFGVAGTPSTRAKPLLTAIGVDPDGYACGDVHLGHLTGDQARMVAARDRLRDNDPRWRAAGNRGR